MMLGRTLSPSSARNGVTDMALELLAPAGDMERLQMSVAYGADAVYLAGQLYGMRAFAGNFSREELPRAVELCHSHGTAVHVTCNTMPRNPELEALPEYLEYLQDACVDALIVGDVGVLALAKRYAPKVKLHISTQIGVTNHTAAQFWYDQGVSRVILARELTMDEVAEICVKRPQDLEKRRARADSIITAAKKIPNVTLFVGLSHK